MKTTTISHKSIEFLAPEREKKKIYKPKKQYFIPLIWSRLPRQHSFSRKTGVPYDNYVTETKLTLLTCAHILRRTLKNTYHHLPLFPFKPFLLSIVAFSHSENGLTILTEQ